MEGIKIPNWCNNTLSVIGDENEVKRFKKVMNNKDHHGRERVLSEEPLIPYPEKFRKLTKLSNEWEEKADAYAKKHGKDGADKWWCGDKLSKKQRAAFIKEHGESPSDGFNSGGYEWCIKNWGTKWGFCDPSISQEYDGQIIYYFDSAWSPPVPLIVKMGQMFPKLKFELGYEESGCCFKGKLVMEGGELIVDITEDLESCPACYGDMEHCDCTQKEIVEMMKEETWEEKSQKEMLESPLFIEKAKGE